MTDPDLFDDPEAREWAQRALDDLLPKLRDSAVTVSFVPEEAGLGDIKFALETGLTIMLDKPLILLVAPGRRIPDRLVRAADRIIEWDPSNLAKTQAAIAAVLDEILE